MQRNYFDLILGKHNMSFCIKENLRYLNADVNETC